MTTYRITATFEADTEEEYDAVFNALSGVGVEVESEEELKTKDGE